MAVLAPVLERKLNTEDNVATTDGRCVNMSADEHHNSRIRFNYARLINPDATVGDVIRKETVAQQKVAAPVREQRPYLVENARAEAEIFRADSKINNKQETEASQAEEEENEDLRPSNTTIQYKTKATVKATIDDKISNRRSRLSKLTRRDKVIVAVTLLVIIALFVLVIVNSAVLSNLNAEIGYLNEDLTTARENFTEVLQDKTSYFNEQNIVRVVSEFAGKVGMTK